MQRGDYMHCSMTFYIRVFGILEFGIWRESWNQHPMNFKQWLYTVSVDCCWHCCFAQGQTIGKCQTLFYFSLLFLVYFIDYTTTVVPFCSPLFFFPLFPSTLHLSSLQHYAPPPLHLSSGPYVWVIHISSLDSTFPILFLTSPYFVPTNYASYSLYLTPSSPHCLPIDNPPYDLHFCGSVPVLVVHLVCSCFCFRCGC